MADPDCVVPDVGCKLDGCPRPVNPELGGLCDTHWVTRPDLRKA